MKTEEQIEYRSIPLIITGNYTEGEPQTYDYPGSSSEFEILKIVVEDSEHDISELLSWEEWDEISELVISKIEE